MRNFWNNFSNGFWIEINEKQFIWTVIETFITLVVFSFITHLFFNGEDSSYTTMIAGAALFVAISTRRRLDNQ
jgi:ABC-type iron transport system FetAB permease component